MSCQANLFGCITNTVYHKTQQNEGDLSNIKRSGREASFGHVDGAEHTLANACLSSLVPIADACI
jgi:hypothetical protein